MLSRSRSVGFWRGEHDTSQFPTALTVNPSTRMETMVNGLAVGPALLRHENRIHDVVRRYHHNTTESSLLTTAHGVNHLPLSSAHRKRLLSVDTILEVRPTRPSVSEF